MAPPAPLECSVEGCAYKTAPGAPTWEACITLLTTHAQSVHGVGGTRQTTPTGSKLAGVNNIPIWPINIGQIKENF